MRLKEKFGRFQQGCRTESTEMVVEVVRVMVDESTADSDSTTVEFP